MTHLINEIVDIYQFPATEVIKNTSEITIGDLHGNAVKLLYFLIRQGICTFSAKNYQRYVEIYLTPVHQYTAALIEEINALSAQIEIADEQTLVRLLGDEVADRGSNDYLVLKILERLHLGSAQIEIILSNHGAEFIEAYERFDERRQRFETSMVLPFTQSIHNMTRLVEQGLLLSQTLLTLAEKHYKPLVKLLSFTMKTKAFIFTHAGVGLETIKAVSAMFEQPFADRTPNELNRTIQDINLAFKPYLENNQVHKLFSRSLEDDNPIAFMVWNRNYTGLDRPSYYNFVHGHDALDPTRNNIINLDSNLGKSTELNKEWYRVLCL